MFCWLTIHSLILTMLRDPPRVLTVQQKCHVNTGVYASVHRGSHCSYSIPCSPHRRIGRISVTEVAEIASTKLFTRCDGAQPKQTFVTSFSFHLDLVRNIDRGIASQGNRITRETEYLFLYTAHNGA